MHVHTSEAYPYKGVRVTIPGESDRYVIPSDHIDGIMSAIKASVPDSWGLNWCHLESVNEDAEAVGKYLPGGWIAVFIPEGFNIVNDN